MTSVQPRTTFEWGIYADGTLAGLSLLIPIPLLDIFFERLFRRRMLDSIARTHGRVLPAAVRDEFRRSEEGCLSSCLTLPFTLLFELIKRLSRKILYFLTIKEASDKLSYYWHRAFLIDYMLSAGHLESAHSARIARRALEETLESIAAPMQGLASQIIGGTRHIWSTLRRARRGRDDEVLQETKGRMSQRWNDYAGYLRATAERYEQLYQQLSAAAAEQHS